MPTSAYPPKGHQSTQGPPRPQPTDYQLFQSRASNQRSWIRVKMSPREAIHKMTINNEHQWGETFTSTNKSPTAYRLIYQNVNDLSTNTTTRFNKTDIIIAATRDLQLDAHMIIETNACWGNETTRRGNEAAFMAALGKGTLIILTVFLLQLTQTT